MSGSKLIRWEPGDATRYEVVLTELPERSRIHGADFVLADMGQGTAVVFGSTECVEDFRDDLYYLTDCIQPEGGRRYDSFIHAVMVHRALLGLDETKRAFTEYDDPWRDGRRRRDPNWDTLEVLDCE